MLYTKLDQSNIVYNTATLLCSAPSSTQTVTVDGYSFNGTASELAPSLGVTPLESHQGLWRQKTIVYRLPCSIVFVMTCLIVLIEL